MERLLPRHRNLPGQLKREIAPLTNQPTFGDFVLGLEGLAILRSWMIDPTTVKDRSKEIVELVRRLNEPPWSNSNLAIERPVTSGYAQSVNTYDDGPNPVILAEEPIVRSLLAKYPAGHALDAACGTGRHTSYLSSLGHEVIGIDATVEMLAVAESKAPSAQFKVADLASMPLPDGSIELAVCSLALTHCRNLRQALTELGRVLKHGGALVISDVHPFIVMLGSHSGYPGTNNKAGFVRNHVHLPSAYLSAFREAGLDVVQCIEPLYGDKEIAEMSFAEQINEVRMQDLVEAAVKDMPIVIIWELKRRS